MQTGILLVNGKARGVIVNNNQRVGLVSAGSAGGGGSSSVAALDDLTDVQITAVADDDILTYDTASGLWKNEQPSSSGIFQFTDTIDISTDTGTFVFTTPQADSSWELLGYVIKSSDGSPSAFTMVIYNKTANGFDYILNGAVPTANYTIVVSIASNVASGSTPAALDSDAQILAWLGL